MSTLKHLDSPSFDVAINSAQTPVLVDFFADWCGPCRALAPTLETLADEAAGALEIVKVDIDENPELATRFGVQKIPTLVLFDDGNPVAQITGVVPKGELEKQLEPFIGSIANRVN